MKDREALKIGAGPLDPLSSAEGVNGFLPTILAVAAAGAVVFGLLASGSSEPLVLTLLAVLAMLGMFLLFGIAAGHIRIGARTPPGDIVKAAVDACQEPQIVAQTDGAPLYWNSAADTMFGRNDAGPLAAIEAAVSADAEASQALFRLMRSAERGEVRREDIQLKPVAGRQTTWVRISVSPFVVSGDDPRERLAAWQIVDITADKASEAQRIDGLESALTSFDAMPVGFMSIAADGRLVYVNTSFESWLGYASGGLRGRTVRLADLAGEDGARLLSSLAQSPDAEKRTVDLDLVRRDSRMVPLTLLVEPLGDSASGQFTITAINRVTAGLAGDGHEDLQVSQFFQSAPFGIATLDGEGRIANCNAAFMRMALDGQPAQDVPAVEALCGTAEPEERARIEAGIGEALAGRGNIQPVEVTAGAQKQFTRRVYLSPLAAIPGGAAAALYVIDATEQKALEARYAQSQKMEAVGKLAGGIAHDFNNVLTAIIGFSDLLLQTHRPSDPAYRDIKNIQSAANRAAGLVANLLGFSRKQTQQVTTIDIGEFVAEITPILRTAAGEKIDLKMQSGRDLWYVRADQNQLFNVVLNLVRNARDAMPDGGKITIRTGNVTERESHKIIDIPGFNPSEYVLIEVADTGTGMSAEVMSKIFEPFFTTKGVGKGTGLGLSSVYGIVKQSGGFIVPESELGQGTTFKVYLPRHVVENGEENEALQSQKNAAKKKSIKAGDLTGTGTVLLVEDEVEVRQFAVRALKRQGYQVLEATDGVEALELMRANPGTIDIVVSDVVMPEMDGPTLFKELRKENPAIKVIFVSGYPNEAFRESLGSEDFAFLPKPFSLPELAAKVKEELAK
jgi:two-component system cell cycle sensor histidine kinase/response regulator CckA